VLRRESRRGSASVDVDDAGVLRDVDVPSTIGRLLDEPD
jgi:hypothetical protein